MLRTPSVSLPLPEPIALLDATLLFLIQVLIAQHPDLLTASESPEPPAPGLRAARRILEAVRELHHTLETYAAVLPDDPARLGDHADDDIPF
jgi:hypothetical protein